MPNMYSAYLVTFLVPLMLYVFVKRFGKLIDAKTKIIRVLLLFTSGPFVIHFLSLALDIEIFSNLRLPPKDFFFLCVTVITSCGVGLSFAENDYHFSNYFRIPISIVTMFFIGLGLFYMTWGTNQIELDRFNNRAEIGTSGGRIISTNYPIEGVEVIIPKGALRENTKIDISASSTKCPIDKNIPVVDLKPDGLMFDKPVTIGLPIQGVSSGKYQVFCYDDTGLVLTEIKMDSIKENGISSTAYIQSNHFSKYFVSKEFALANIETANSEKGFDVAVDLDNALEMPTLSTEVRMDILTRLGVKMVMGHNMEKKFPYYVKEALSRKFNLMPLVVTIGVKIKKRVPLIMGKDPILFSNKINIRIWDPTGYERYSINVEDSKGGISFQVENISIEEIEKYISGEAFVFHFVGSGDDSKITYKYYTDVTWQVKNILGEAYFKVTDELSFSTKEVGINDKTLPEIYVDKDLNGIVDRYQATIGNPPGVPYDPIPPDNIEFQMLKKTFSWKCSDPDDDIHGYKFYLDTNDPPRNMQEILNNSCTIDNLQPNRRYYWQVIATDKNGNSTSGPVWSFTTFPVKGKKPTAPHDPYPDDGATDIPINVELNWKCEDPSNLPLQYSVYLGPGKLDMENTMVASWQTKTSWKATNLRAGTKYYWGIVSKNTLSELSQSPKWSFTTSGKKIGEPAIFIINDIKDKIAYDLADYRDDIAIKIRPLLKYEEVDLNNDGKNEYFAIYTPYFGIYETNPLRQIYYGWSGNRTHITSYKVLDEIHFGYHHIEVTKDNSQYPTESSWDEGSRSYEGMIIHHPIGR